MLTGSLSSSRWWCILRQFLNTLYVQTEGTVLRLDHENVIAEVDNEVKKRVPIHHLGSIVVIGRVLVTAPLSARCAKDGRTIVHLDSQGRFLFRIEGPKSGNVLLRTAQHHLARGTPSSLRIVQGFIAGKLYNSRQMLLRAGRETSDPDKRSELQGVAEEIQRDLRKISSIADLNELRGLEGINAKRYFAQFNNRLKPTVAISFAGRTRRPPRDPVNALISFLYALLLNDIVGALEGVGLDPQVGFLHGLRPGRPSLALDLMEEFRPILADSLAVALINRLQIQETHFQTFPGGAVHLNEKGRGVAVIAFQERKRDVITHSLAGEKMEIGLVPHVQARILARAIRKDHVEYEPFLYR